MTGPRRRRTKHLPDPAIPMGWHTRRYRPLLHPTAPSRTGTTATTRRYPGTSATVAMAETAGAITEPTAYPTATLARVASAVRTDPRSARLHSSHSVTPAAKSRAKNHSLGVARPAVSTSLIAGMASAAISSRPLTLPLGRYCPLELRRKFRQESHALPLSDLPGVVHMSQQCGDLHGSMGSCHRGWGLWL